MDTRQYLYCLKPKPEFAEKAGIIKGVTVIGKLDIVWKTNLGERGRLQTSQLQRMVPVHYQLEYMIPSHSIQYGCCITGHSQSQCCLCGYLLSGGDV